MTQPDGNGGNLQISFNIVKAPDNKHWIGCNLAHGFTSYNFAMPPKAWQEFTDNLPKAVKELAAQCRQHDSGLVVETNLNNIAKENRNVR